MDYLVSSSIINKTSLQVFQNENKLTSLFKEIAVNIHISVIATISVHRIYNNIYIKTCKCL